MVHITHCTGPWTVWSPLKSIIWTKSWNVFIKNLNFFSSEERMTWTSWMTRGWVNYQQKWTTPYVENLQPLTQFPRNPFSLQQGSLCSYVQKIKYFDHLPWRNICLGHHKAFPHIRTCAKCFLHMCGKYVKHVCHGASRPGMIIGWAKRYCCFYGFHFCHSRNLSISRTLADESPKEQWIMNYGSSAILDAPCSPMHFMGIFGCHDNSAICLYILIFCIWLRKGKVTS